MKNAQFKKYIQTCVVLAVLLLVLLYAKKQDFLQKQVWNSAAEMISVQVQNPRVNYMENPIGIDEARIFFSWVPNVKQKAYEILVWKADTKEVAWDSGVVVSDETIQIMYEGKPLEDCTEYEYNIYVFDEQDNVYGSEKAFFETAFISGEVFSGAKMICMAPEEVIYEDGQAVYYMTFEKLPKELAKATFYGSALGMYDAYINAERVGNDELKPGWTDYAETLLYNAYDITASIRESNTVAAMVGTGWWCGRNGFGTYDYHQPAFICQIILEYQDGEKQIISTDETWKYTKNTAVRFADFFNGETYDETKLSTKQISEKQDVVLRADEKDVHISTDFSGEYKSYYAYNVKHVEEKDNKAISAYVYDSVTADGTDFGSVNVVRSYDGDMFPVVLKEGETLIVDLGQNMTGVPYLEYEAPEGTQIEVQVAEMLNDSGQAKRGNDGAKGTLYRANYRSATTLLQLKTAGGKGSWRPTFFYTGFRYLSLTANKDMTVKGLQGLFIGNSAPETASFLTDNEDVTKLWENVNWSQRNNFLLVATDCPQRDERIGWMGDLCSFADTSMYMQQFYGFYEKWMTDAAAAQTPEGAYTDTVPATITTGNGNAGWADAGILIPLSVYKKYGDKQLLSQQYASMQLYMDYLASISSFKPEEKRMGALTTYGDWLAAQYSENAMISALWYEADALAMAETAEILGKKTDARNYKKLYEKINEYILQTYAYKLPWTENREVDGQLYELSQTEMLFLLRYSKLTDEQEEMLATQLAKNIKDNDYKVMTGFAGTPLLLPVLTQYSMNEEAYRILLCEENPSWLYSVRQGATTIWERYDSYTKENGFADAAMNSFNHFNEGSVAQWMFESMLGISVDLSQEQPITIRPVLPSAETAISKASGYYDSVYGTIELIWEKQTDGNVCVRLSLPVNATAKVCLPLEGMETMTVSGGQHEWIGKLRNSQ